MADDITTTLRFIGDAASAEAAINSLIASLQKAAAAAKSTFASTANGSSQSAAALNQLSGAAQSARTATQSGAQSALAYAQATARLQVAQGNAAGAVKTLENALAGVDRSTVAAIRAQTQLVSVQAQAATAAGKAETSMLREAQALARLQQIAGDTPAAIRTMTEALTRAINPQSLAALRAQLQKTYLDTNYANSPLIGAIRSINQGLGAMQPLLGSAGARLQGLVGIAGRVASSLGATGTAAAGISSSLGAAGTTAAGAAGSLGSAGAAAAGFSAALGPIIIGAAAAAAAIVGLVAAAGSVVSALRSIGEAGIETNARLESIRLGIATVIASVGELRNSEGIQLRGIDELNAALPIAADQMRKLQIDALQTSATIADIAPAFQAAIGPGLVAGLTIDQIRDNTIKLTQAVTALGLPLDQIKQETRAILSGEINRNTQAAIALGITREAVKAAQQEGRFAEFLAEKLEAAAAAGKLVAQTFEAARSNLQEAGDVFQATVTQGLFDQLRDSLNQILPQVFDTKSANLISDNFKGIADTLTRVFDTAGKTLADLIQFIFNGLKQVSSFLDQNQATIGEIIASVDAIVRLVGETIAGVAEIVFGSVNMGKELDAVSGILKVIVRIIGFMGDQIKIVTSAFFTLGNVIKLVLVTPLEFALRLIGAIVSVIPGAGSAVQSLARQLTLARQSATTGVVESAKNFGSAIANIGQSTAAALKRIEDARKRAASGQRAFAGLDRATGSADGTTVRPPRRTDDEESKSAVARRRQEAQAELKLLQLREKELELSTKRETEAIKIALQDRLISFEQYTEFAVQLDRELLQAKLETLALEEEVAVRTAKNRTEAEAKRAEIALKRRQTIQETDLRTEALRDDLRRTQEKAEEDHQKRLVEIREVGRKALENSLREQLRSGVIGAVEAERAVQDVERERFAEREALLRRELSLAGENLQERQRVNDELAKLAAERAAFEVEASGKVRDALRSEAADFADFIRARVRSLADLRRSELQAQAAQAALAVQRGALSGRAAQVQELERRRELVRLESIERQRDIERQAADLQRQAQTARQGAAALVQIEQEKNAALVAERQRANAELAILDTQRLALEQSIAGGFSSLFSQRVLELAEAQSLFKANLQAFIEEIQETITPLDEIGRRAFEGFAEGIGATVQNFVLLGRTGPAVIRRLLAEQLAAIAKEAAVNAIKELALGFASLFVNPAKAAGHFTSAALWASLAGGTALVGRAIAPSQGGAGGGTGAGASGGGDGRTIEQGGPLRQQPVVVVIRAETQEGVIVRQVIDDYKRNGQLRETLRRDLVRD